MIFEPSDNKSWLLFGVNYFLLGVFWQLFQPDIQGAVVFRKQILLSEVFLILFTSFLFATLFFHS
jgi:hypothetical protein